jgi:integrase
MRSWSGPDGAAAAAGPAVAGRCVFRARHRLHDARHTAGTLLGEQHVDIHVIQRILGHAQVTTTRIYTEPTDPLTREAAGLIGKALWPDAAKLRPQLQPEAGQ